MKIYNYAKFPEGFDYNYGDICDFDTWDLERLKDFDEVYYWYATGSYEGSGHLIGLLKGKWYMHDCGHCSCYGPTEHLDVSENFAYDSLEELERACSKGLIPQVRPLIDMAKEKADKEPYAKRMEREIREAYGWIRENNHTISDEVLDLMKNAAIEKVKS